MPVLESSQLDSDKTSASAASTSLIDDSWNFVRKHPGETALGAGLALGVIALSKGRAVGVAEREIAPLARAASERGTLNLATGAVESAPEVVAQVHVLGGLHSPVFRNGIVGPATRELAGSGIPNTGLNRALSANEHLPLAAPWNRASAIDGNANLSLGAFEAKPTTAEPLSVLAQTEYKFVPFKPSAASIRQLSSPTQMTTEGPSRIVFGEDNFVQTLLFNRNASDVEKFNLMTTARYAELIKSDVLAAKAAGTVPGRTIGFIQEPIERLATPEQMQQNAVAGAKAYVEMNANGANSFTKYLTERFGPLTNDSPDLGRDFMTRSLFTNIRSAASVGKVDSVAAKPRKPW